MASALKTSIAALLIQTAVDHCRGDDVTDLVLPCAWAYRSLRAAAASCQIAVDFDDLMSAESHRGHARWRGPCRAISIRICSSSAERSLVPMCSRCTTP